MNHLPGSPSGFATVLRCRILSPTPLPSDPRRATPLTGFPSRADGTHYPQLPTFVFSFWGYSQPCSELPPGPGLKEHFWQAQGSTVPPGIGPAWPQARQASFSADHLAGPLQLPTCNPFLPSEFSLPSEERCRHCRVQQAFLGLASPWIVHDRKPGCGLCPCDRRGLAHGARLGTSSACQASHVLEEAVRAGAGKPPGPSSQDGAGPAATPGPAASAGSDHTAPKAATHTSLHKAGETGRGFRSLNPHLISIVSPLAGELPRSLRKLLGAG